MATKLEVQKELDDLKANIQVALRKIADAACDDALEYIEEFCEITNSPRPLVTTTLEVKLSLIQSDLDTSLIKYAIMDSLSENNIPYNDKDIVVKKLN